MPTGASDISAPRKPEKLQRHVCAPTSAELLIRRTALSRINENIPLVCFPCNQQLALGTGKLEQRSRYHLAAAISKTNKLGWYRLHARRVEHILPVSRGGALGLR